MATRKTYPGSERSWTLQVTDDTGVLYNPAQFKVHVKDSLGNYTEYVYGVDSQLTRTSTGVYKFTLDIPYLSTSSGNWAVDGQALDGGTVVSKEVEPIILKVEELRTL